MLAGCNSAGLAWISPEKTLTASGAAGASAEAVPDPSSAINDKTAPKMASAATPNRARENRRGTAMRADFILVFIFIIDL